MNQSRSRLDARRIIAVMWPQGDGDPAVHTAGDPAVANWLDLEEDWRRTFDDARDWLPLTITPVGAMPDTDTTRGFVAVLSGARDVVVCLEHAVPRAISAEDRQLVMALFGHISLAMQHVRQFEIARETSLTLQRSLLPADHVAPRLRRAVRARGTSAGDRRRLLRRAALRRQPHRHHRRRLRGPWPVRRGGDGPAARVDARTVAHRRRTGRVLEQLDSVAEFIPDAFCTTVFVAIVRHRTPRPCATAAPDMYRRCSPPVRRHPSC